MSLCSIKKETNAQRFYISKCGFVFPLISNDYELYFEGISININQPTANLIHVDGDFQRGFPLKKSWAFEMLKSCDSQVVRFDALEMVTYYRKSHGSDRALLDVVFYLSFPRTSLPDCNLIFFSCIWLCSRPLFCVTVCFDVSIEEFLFQKTLKPFLSDNPIESTYSID